MSDVDIERLEQWLRESALAELEPLRIDQNERVIGESLQIEADGIWLATVPSFDEFPCVEDEQQMDVDNRAKAVASLFCGLANAAPALIAAYRERDELRKRLDMEEEYSVRNQQRAERAEAELDEARADKDRLDWLERQPDFAGKPWKITHRIDGVWTIREAIDAARKAEAEA